MTANHSRLESTERKTCNLRPESETVVKLRKFTPIVILPALFSLSEAVEPATAQATHKAYIYCETKTIEPERWFFSAIFMEGPEVRQSTMEAAFTRYVVRNYQDSTKQTIGPADCVIKGTRQAAEDWHDYIKRGEEGSNTITETGWTYSE